MDKFVKLSAIEKMAKPMASFHKGEEMPMKDHSGCKCPCCGAPCAECSDNEHENSEEYDTEE